jgi:hypothetical protein
MNVSFYLHGLISFGAIVAGMIATSGDEAFVMFAVFPKEAMLLTVILFAVGIVSGWLVDRLGTRLKLLPDARCLINRKNTIGHAVEDDLVVGFFQGILLLFPVMTQPNISRYRNLTKHEI